MQQPEHSLEGRLALDLCALFIGRSACTVLLDTSCAEERGCLLARMISAKTHIQLKNCCCAEHGRYHIQDTARREGRRFYAVC